MVFLELRPINGYSCIRQPRTNDRLTSERKGKIMTSTLDQFVKDLPEISESGKRLLKSDAGGPTNAGWREANIRLLMSRGADRSTAERLDGYSLTVSSRGTVGAKDGSRAFPLSRRECELLGREPGPGND